ncbi:hypothetical protein Q8F55_003267 [Vanrija albida]|uniref:Ricin B lectin domain-containing protein n=1 Tax=Vanrija albida TaxID=181172 RepID=A0ABR3QBZ3_9TREE
MFVSILTSILVATAALASPIVQPDARAEVDPRAQLGGTLRPALRDTNGDWRLLIVGRNNAFSPENGLPASLARSARRLYGGWVLPNGWKGQIQVGDSKQGTRYCLDAGSWPQNGVEIKIWECLNVPQQQWHVHDGVIELVGHGLCLDVRDGNLDGKVQTWQCYKGNRNQQWELVNFNYSNEQWEPVNSARDEDNGLAAREATIEDNHAHARDDTPMLETRDAVDELDTRAELYGRAANTAYLQPKLRNWKNGSLLFTVARDLTHALQNGDKAYISETGRRSHPHWIVRDGWKGQIQVHDTATPWKRYCLDAGSWPQNGIELKVWECLDVPQQQWHVHDGVIELVGYGLCLDVRDGKLNWESVIQTWQCYPGNTNQQWVVVPTPWVRDAIDEGHDARDEVPTLEARDVEARDEPPEDYIRIKPALKDANGHGRWFVIQQSYRLPLQNGNRTILHFSGRSLYNYWEFPDGWKGQIQVKDSNPGKRYCLDAGSWPQNGVLLKVWECLDVPQQQWHVHDGVIELVGYNLCLDVRDGNLREGGVVQTWQCFHGNKNQQFEVYKNGERLQPVAKRDAIAGGNERNARDVPMLEAREAVNELDNRDVAVLGPRAEPPRVGLRSALRDANGGSRIMVVPRQGLPLENGDQIYLDTTGRRLYSGFSVRDGWRGQIAVTSAPSKRFCLDAGLNPHDGVHLKVWECLDVPQQQWYVHDGVIELVGYGLCLDVRDGSFNPGIVQTWHCYGGNRNQQWEIAS